MLRYLVIAFVLILGPVVASAADKGSSDWDYAMLREVLSADARGADIPLW